MRTINGVVYYVKEDCGRFSHSFREWTINPELGVKIRSCAICGKIETKNIKKISAERKIK